MTGSFDYGCWALSLSAVCTLDNKVDDINTGLRAEEKWYHSSIMRQTNRERTSHIHVLVNLGLSRKEGSGWFFSTDFKASRENEL